MPNVLSRSVREQRPVVPQSVVLLALQRAASSASCLLLRHLIALSQPNLEMSFKGSRENVAGHGAQSLSPMTAVQIQCIGDYFLCLSLVPLHPKPCCQVVPQRPSPLGLPFHPVLNCWLRLLTWRPGKLCSADTHLQSAGGGHHTAIHWS